MPATKMESLMSALSKVTKAKRLWVNSSYAWLLQSTSEIDYSCAYTELFNGDDGLLFNRCPLMFLFYNLLHRGAVYLNICLCFTLTHFSQYNLSCCMFITRLGDFQSQTGQHPNSLWTEECFNRRRGLTQILRSCFC